MQLTQLQTAQSSLLPKAIRQQETLIERKRAKLAETDVSTTSVDDIAALEQEKAKLDWLNSTLETVAKLLASA